MLARVVDRGTGTASRADDSALLSITDRTGREISPGLSMQLCQGLREILCVNELVGRVLELHLPAVGRRWWWRDEEELASVGEVEVLVFDFDGCWCAEVDFYALAHDGFTV